MISNMYDLSGQAVLSTKGYRLELWRMRRSDIRKKNILERGGKRSLPGSYRRVKINRKRKRSGMSG
mgnify:CR=1 FL=1